MRMPARMGRAVLVLLLGGLGCGPSLQQWEEQTVRGIQFDLARLEQERARRKEEHRIDTLCAERSQAERSQQVLREWQACLTTYRGDPAEQQACYAAVSDDSTYATQLDCRRYQQKSAAFRERLRKAKRICLQIYPRATPTFMYQEWAACMDARMGLPQ